MKTLHAAAGAELTRRDFVVSTAAAAGGLALGLSAPFDAQAQAAGHELNVWVVVQPDERCVIRIARSEMGQGTLTGLAQLVVEELECDWSKVLTQQISPQQNFAAKRAWGEMGTGGSRGIRTSHDYVRRGARRRSKRTSSQARPATVTTLPVEITR